MSSIHCQSISFWRPCVPSRGRHANLTPRRRVLSDGLGTSGGSRRSPREHFHPRTRIIFRKNMRFMHDVDGCSDVSSATETQPMKNAPKHRGTLIARLVIVSAALFAVAVSTTRAAKAEEWTKNYPISGRPQVRVETNDGAVQVTTSGDQKAVEF